MCGAGDVCLAGLMVPAADAQLLASLASLAEGLGAHALRQTASSSPNPNPCVPSPRDPRQQPGHGGETSLKGTPAKREEAPALTLGRASLALENTIVEHVVEVAVPEHLRAPGAPARVRCLQRLALRRLAADVRLARSSGSAAGGRRALGVVGGAAELAWLEVTYREQAAPPAGPVHEPGLGSILGLEAAAPVSTEVVVCVVAVERARIDAARAAAEPASDPNLSDVSGRLAAVPLPGAAGTAECIAASEISCAQVSGSGSGSKLAASAEVSGVRARFEAEPVFAALHAAADARAAWRAVVERLHRKPRRVRAVHPTPEPGPAGSNGAPGGGGGNGDAPPGKVDALCGASKATAAAAEEARGRSLAEPLAAARGALHAGVPGVADQAGGAAVNAAPSGHRPRRLNPSVFSALDLVVTVRDAAAQAVVAENIVWGASLRCVRAEAASQSAALEGLEVTLNARPLATLASVVVGVSLGSAGGPRVSPWAGERADLAEALKAGSHVSPGPTDFQASGAALNPGSTLDPTMQASVAARPFGRRCERLPDALRCAGVGVHGQSPNPTPAKAYGSSADAAGSGAAVVVEAWLEGVTANVPHDQDFGTAERATEIWAKAFRQALAGSLEVLGRAGAPFGGDSGLTPIAGAPTLNPAEGLTGRVPASSPAECLGAPSRSKGMGAPRLELRVAARGVAFQMEHHPTEAWLAVHGPLLRNCAAARALWARVLDAVAPPASGGSGGGAGSSAEASPEKPNPKEPHPRPSPGLARSSPSTLVRMSPSALKRTSSGGRVAAPDDGSAAASSGGAYAGAAEAIEVEAAREYRRQCEQGSPAGSVQPGALMHVVLGEAEALLVLCAGGAAGEATALAQVAAVDPPSAGVAFTQVLHISRPAKTLAFTALRSGRA